MVYFKITQIIKTASGEYKRFLNDFPNEHFELFKVDLDWNLK